MSVEKTVRDRVEEIVRQSHTLLGQMTAEPEMVLEALDPEEQDRVVAELEVLAERAAKVQTEADLLTATDAVHRLVEETPALAALFPPKEMDVEATQEQRTVPASYHKEAHEKSQYAQEHATRIRNRVIECREELKRALRESSQPEERR